MDGTSGIVMTHMMKGLLTGFLGGLRILDYARQFRQSEQRAKLLFHLFLHVKKCCKSAETLW